ncbi:hypothetical protein M434DRAFT_399050 [Hypoxylon sp. CO27-5]|nr:hypothetical protein M434DRAFT_399050 [Hypoxylon sp. CO27-5]
MQPSLGKRPREIHTKHLTERERFRVRTLYFDAFMSKKRIEEVTGYSIGQIRHAISAKSSAVAPRSGRPKKARNGQAPANQPAEDDGSSPQGFPEESSTVVPSSSTSSTPAQLAPIISPAPPQERAQRASLPSFNQLPPEIRRHIWYLVLTSASPSPPPSSSPSPTTSSPSTPPSSSSSSSPLSCTWWISPLPHPPFLITGVFPAHWTTHWKSYLDHRQPAAWLLSHVSREARQVVLDTFTPIWSEAGLRMLGSTVQFLWIDARHDEIYFKDGDGESESESADALPGLLEKSRAAVLPHLSRVAGGCSASRINGISRP